MEFLPRPMISSIILLVIGCFCLGTATNCDGNLIAKTITIDQRGKGEFQMIQDGIDSIKSNNEQWTKIHINSGVYIEQVTIPIDKPCIILEGDGSQSTIITYGKYHQGKSWGATFVSSPPNVIVSGITFKNSFNVARWSKLHTSTATIIEPAVAAIVYGDQSVFFKCSFVSYQDTLFAARGRHYFKDCYIQGEADFIFGYGQSYFKNCKINATQGNFPLALGFITAQGRHSPNDPSGFVFEGGSVDGTGKVDLGRAWGPYSRVIFRKTEFSSVVNPEGWSAWHYKDEKDKITYAEVNCTGPGANNVNRVTWLKKLNPSQQREYSVSSFINKDGWLETIPTIFLQFIFSILS